MHFQYQIDGLRNTLLYLSDRLNQIMAAPANANPKSDPILASDFLKSPVLGKHLKKIW